MSKLTSWYKQIFGSSADLELMANNLTRPSYIRKKTMNDLEANMGVTPKIDGMIENAYATP